MRREKSSPQQLAIQNSKFNNLGKMNAFMQMIFQDEIDEDTRIQEQIQRLTRKRERLNKNSPAVEDFLIALAKQLMKITGGKIKN